MTTGRRSKVKTFFFETDNRFAAVFFTMLLFDILNKTHEFRRKPGRQHRRLPSENETLFELAANIVSFPRLSLFL